MNCDVAMTGAGGFLGWHVRAALRDAAGTCAAIAVGAGFDEAEAVSRLDGTDRLIHIAGVNRGNAADVYEGNVSFAEQLSAALRHSSKPPSVVVNANTTQVGNSSAYGESKALAGTILGAAAREVGAVFIDIELPNLFGEHGKPFYNAVTATFCHILAEGGTPTVLQDKELTLLHAQDAADLLTGRVPHASQAQLQRYETVSGLLRRLTEHSLVYSNGEIPDISQPFSRDLFNTYRSHVVKSHMSIPLMRHADQRGSFFEVVRTHGGTGQYSFSTTETGVSRGDHFHRRKVERFTVLSGRARISLRKLFSDEEFSVDVAGDSPVAVDMPTMWAHRIENIGPDLLYTSFWTHDLFDPDSPDTISEIV